ncbi:MAG: hypothetical protein FOGNACKC_05175 [Anaerolineae bacterium]|nr:hypothetical protein [Anaerolineae bacterium]
MALKPKDTLHFYVDDKLVDLVWINHHIQQQTNAANYHEMTRTIGWLKKLAQRILDGRATDRDEQTARKKLAAVGLNWYLE